MANAFFLITGASRGIGEATAKKILREGNTVLGISRKQSDSIKSPNYYHLNFDLNDTSRFNLILDRINKIFNGRSFDFICLINNAAVIEPVGPIEKCSAAEIETHIRIGLVAPMLLTSMFIKRFNDMDVRKKVVYISSGVAFNPAAEASIYSSSKAAINMLAQCVGLEQKDRKYGFEINSIGPGMVNTDMQLAARSKSSEEFAGAEFFKQAFKEGRLQESDKVAEKIYTILVNKYEQGRYVSVSEV